MPPVNPNLFTPLASAQKVVQYAVIRALNPLMYVWRDEGGVVRPILLRDYSVKEESLYPNITVKVEGGTTEEGSGDNIVTEDDDGNTFYEVSCIGLRVKMQIEATSALARERLVDYLTGGAHSFTVLDQTTPQFVVPQAVQRSLSANGVWLRATEDVSLPDPAPTEPRPADTIYKASWTWRCDVSLQWQTQGTTIDTVAVSATATSGNQSVTTVFILGGN